MSELIDSVETINTKSRSETRAAFVLVWNLQPRHHPLVRNPNHFDFLSDPWGSNTSPTSMGYRHNVGRRIMVAADAVQETLLRAGRYRDSVKEGAPLGPVAAA